MTEYRAHILKNTLEYIFHPGPSRGRRAVLQLLTYGIHYEDFLVMRQNIDIKISKADMIEVENAYRDIAREER